MIVRIMLFSSQLVGVLQPARAKGQASSAKTQSLKALIRTFFYPPPFFSFTARKD